MNDEDGLSIGTEEHEVGLPMAGLGPRGDGGGPLADGHTVLDVVDRAGATPAMAAAAMLSTRREVVPVVLRLLPAEIR